MRLVTKATTCPRSKFLGAQQGISTSWPHKSTKAVQGLRASLCSCHHHHNQSPFVAVHPHLSRWGSCIAVILFTMMLLVMMMIMMIVLFMIVFFHTTTNTISGFILKQHDKPHPQCRGCHAPWYPRPIGATRGTHFRLLTALNRPWTLDLPSPIADSQAQPESIQRVCKVRRQIVMYRSNSQGMTFPTRNLSYAHKVTRYIRVEKEARRKRQEGIPRALITLSLCSSKWEMAAVALHPFAPLRPIKDTLAHNCSQYNHTLHTTSHISLCA